MRRSGTSMNDFQQRPPACGVFVRKSESGSVEHRVTDFPCLIGRRSACDLVIRDPSISGRHAVLRAEASARFVLEDCGSTNGICLNGKRVEQIGIDGPTEVRMGSVMVRFVPEGRETPLPERAPIAKPADESPQSGHGEITCPHCWHRFDVEDFLYIARHQSLLGDPVLGNDEQQRFYPSAFTPEGNAIDSMGASCPDTACPNCHLRIPRNAGDMPPLFISIVGAAGSGKSFFLTTMIWELRNRLSRLFAVSFRDTDAVNNHLLNEFEETLFLNADPDELTTLRKTELQGDLYNQVLLDGMTISLPKPFMFTVTPAEHHPEYERVRDRMSRTLVLYDNAGEHFEPGMDSVENPATRHLLHSDTFLFLFDPTKDARFRARLESADPQLAKGVRVQRQEILLTETINRLSKYSGMRAGRKTSRTLVVVVSKCDVWKELLSLKLPVEPWAWEPEYNTCGLDMDTVKNVSFATRHLLEEVCPELVSTAEAFAGNVLYVPVSALGGSPEREPTTSMLGIRPKDIQPIWTMVPMLAFFCERGFVPALPGKHPVDVQTEKVSVRKKGDVVFVQVPGREKPLQVPLYYLGARLRCPETGVWFDLPERDALQTAKGPTEAPVERSSSREDGIRRGRDA